MEPPQVKLFFFGSAFAQPGYQVPGQLFKEIEPEGGKGIFDRLPGHVDISIDPQLIFITAGVRNGEQGGNRPGLD